MTRMFANNYLLFLNAIRPVSRLILGLVVLISSLLVTLPSHAADLSGKTVPSGPAGTEPQEKSATELNKQLSNPVSSLWSIAFQNNNYYLHNPDRWQSNLNFQPVLPVALTRKLNLITRPVFTIFTDTPYMTHDGDLSRTTAFGDTVLLTMLSPNMEHWLLGFGPTFIFPTAASDVTGQGKYQVGPAAVLGYLSKKYIVGVFPQQWCSFGGSSKRRATSQLNLQYFASYFFGKGWSIGPGANILANWMAPSRDCWTVPVGLGVGKVVKLGKLPVKLGINGQYMAVRPSNFGQQWNIQISVAPVIPKLIKGNLFE